MYSSRFTVREKVKVLYDGLDFYWVGPPLVGFTFCPRNSALAFGLTIIDFSLMYGHENGLSLFLIIYSIVFFGSPDDFFGN
ncbi:uncharacterized protein BDW43DRAFT_57733 [Aspergillus alliaceus]|uniref:uncharacterized protein n=1 Tax=Petromyces alliaceus TaxID=209559 RepID=UPI0012A43171|nr:uncharacterized protein BDW43DRAFT_57733 [Aspergillus alliaceus]KAB8234580.1 hypothetical protein BDW43DRAFT_57733 [Aspergillus alliaceus]